MTNYNYLSEKVKTQNQDSFRKSGNSLETSAERDQQANAGASLADAYREAEREDVRYYENHPIEWTTVPDVVPESDPLELLTEGVYLANNQKRRSTDNPEDLTQTLPIYKDTPFFGGIDGQTAILVYGSNGLNEYIRERVGGAISQMRETGERQTLITLYGSPWLVRFAPAGAFNYFAVVEGSGLSFHFTTSPGKTKNKGAEIPVCKIVWSWQLAVRTDPRAVVRQAFEQLTAWGCSVDRYHITRLDLQLTTILFEMSDVELALRENRTVTRVQELGRYGTGRDDVSQTYMWRSKNTGWALRIYDKSEELRKKNQASKTQFFLKHFGRNTFSLVRVEYELLREFLRPIGIDTFDDLYNKGQSLITHLMSRCVRFLESDKGFNHSSRVSVASWWQDVFNMFVRSLEGAEQLKKETKIKPSILLDEISRQRFLSMATTLLSRVLASDVVDLDKPLPDVVQRVLSSVRASCSGAASAMLRESFIEYGEKFAGSDPPF